MDAAPIKPIEHSHAEETLPSSFVVHAVLLDDIWRDCGAAIWGLQRGEFDRIILLIVVAQNFGLVPGTIATNDQQAAFFQNLKLPDLILAKACAAGNERAWEHFMALYGQPLTRAAIAISGNETVGRDLADAFYGELYGLTTRNGERKCPLDSYRGRGSLLGWLRTTLAQRFVDHYRRTFREQPLDDHEHDVPLPNSTPAPEPATLASLRQAVQDSLFHQPPEERFLLAAYYLDDRTLAEIGKLLHVHEATISRRLKRATDAVRKRLMRNLENSGMSRKQAEETLGTDPRDLDLRMDLRKLLQYSEPEPIKDQAAQEQPFANPAAAPEALARAVLPDARVPLPDKAKTTR